MVRTLGISLQLCCLVAIAVTLSSCASFFDYTEHGDLAEMDESCDTSECEQEPTEERLSQRSPAEQRIHSAIEARDVVLGMSRSHVMNSWGPPAHRRQAGKGDAGHELWLYGMRNSLNGERVIVFENGYVAGWYR